MNRFRFTAVCIDTELHDDFSATYMIYWIAGQLYIDTSQFLHAAALYQLKTLYIANLKIIVY